MILNIDVYIDNNIMGIYPYNLDFVKMYLIIIQNTLYDFTPVYIHVLYKYLHY